MSRDPWIALDAWQRLLNDVLAGSQQLDRPASDRVLVEWSCDCGATGIEYPGLLQQAFQLHRETVHGNAGDWIIVTGPVDA